jgi:O-antigen ligase
MGTASALLARSPRHGFLEFTFFILLGLLVLYIATIYKRAPQKFNALFITSIIFAVTISFASFLGNTLSVFNETLTPTFKSLFQGFVNPRFFNQWQGMVLPIVIGALLIYKDVKRKKFLLALLASYLWAGIFFSGGRGVALSVMIGITLTGLLFPRIRYEWWSWTLLTLLGGGLIYASVLTGTFVFTGQHFEDGLGLSRIVENTTTSDRLSLWQYAWHQFIHNPILGIGPMHSALISDATTIAAHPHNIALQLASEWGAPVLILIASVLGTAFLKWIAFSKRQVNSQLHPTFLLAALTSAFTTGNLHALVSGVWVMPLSQLSLALLTGWMLGIWANTKPSNHKIHANTTTIFTAIMLITILIFLYSIYPEVHQLDNWLKESYERIGDPIFHPRFWLQGIIIPD